MALYSCSKRSFYLAASLPVHDFLVPSLLQAPRASSQFRRLTTTQRSYADAPSDDAEKVSRDRPTRIPKSGQDAASNPAPLSKPLTKAQREFLTSAVSLF